MIKKFAWSNFQYKDTCNLGAITSQFFINRRTLVKYNNVSESNVQPTHLYFHFNKG